MSSSSPNARRERTLAPPAPPPGDDDQTGWLLTFSDIVLQLFAFVLVAAVLGSAAPQSEAVTPIPLDPPSPVCERPFEQHLVEPEARIAPPAPTVVAAEPPKAPAEIPPEPTPPSQLAVAGQRLAAFVAAQGGDAASVTVRDSDLVLRLSDRITFASASADLLPAARPFLGELRTLAAALPDYALEVAGHTDDKPIHTAAFPSNLDLSLARAARVARELAADDSNLAVRVFAAGFGEHRPIASNGDEAGRAQNRRVEIRLVRRDEPRA